MLSTPPLSERYPTSAYVAHAEVEAIGGLERLGSTLAGGGSILFSTITADQFDLRMRLYPGFGGFRLAVRQQIQDPVALE